jgi:tight adherence protein C
MLILSCVFLSLFVFFAAYYAFVSITQIGIAGKVYNAVEKRKGKKFILNFIMDNSQKISVVFTRLKYKRFIEYTEKISVILKSIGDRYSKVNSYQFFVLQLLAMLAGTIFVGIFIGRGVVTMVISSVVFFFLPFFKIKEKFKKRKELIERQLPDMTELLSIVLDAGLDFYGAARKVIQIMDGPLADDLRDALSKISLGSDKRLAFTEMAQKASVDQLNFFVKTINMSLESGVGMSDTLKRLSVSLRNSRFAYAEKKAQEAPIKMLVPLMLLIFPTIFIVIFGPIAINFMSAGF